MFKLHFTFNSCTTDFAYHLSKTVPLKRRNADDFISKFLSNCTLRMFHTFNCLFVRNCWTKHRKYFPFFNLNKFINTSKWRNLKAKDTNGVQVKRDNYSKFKYFFIISCIVLVSLSAINIQIELRSTSLLKIKNRVCI